MSEEVNNVEIHPVTESLAEDWVDTRQEYSMGCCFDDDDEAARPNKRKRSVQFKLFGADIVGEKAEDNDNKEVPTEAGCVFFLDLMRRNEDDDDYEGLLPKRFKHFRLFGADILCESEGDGFIFATEHPPSPPLLQNLLSNMMPTSSCSSDGKSNGGLDFDLNLSDNLSDGFWDTLIQ